MACASDAGRTVHCAGLRSHGVSMYGAIAADFEKALGSYCSGLAAAWGLHLPQTTASKRRGAEHGCGSRHSVGLPNHGWRYGLIGA